MRVPCERKENGDEREEVEFFFLFFLESIAKQAPLFFFFNSLLRSLSESASASLAS